MSPARFVFANLRRRPVHVLLVVVAVMIAFMLHGLTLGIAEGFRRAALAERAVVPPSILIAAVAISTVGLALILVLVANATAHSVRVRQHELGVLMALGFTPRRILVLLGAEAASPCVAGAVLGLIGAKVLFAALAALLPALAPVPAPVYTLQMVSTAFVAALSIAAFGTALTASRIVSMDVAAALRGGIPPVGSTRATQAGARVEIADRSAESRETPASGDVADALWLRQVIVVTRIGLSTLPRRYKGGLLIVGSVGLLVAALMIPLAAFDSIRVALARSGDPARVVIRSQGRPSLELNHIPEGLAALVATAPGIARDANGAPLIDTEALAPIGQLIKRNNGEYGYTVVAGVGAQWVAMRPSFRLQSGRMPRPGSQELIVGTLARQKFSGLDDGGARYRGTDWRVVGTFATDDWWDGYLVTSAGDLKAVRASPSDSAVRVRLVSPAAFESFRTAVEKILPPSVIVQRETDFYASFWRMVPRAMVYIVLVLGGLFGAGAAVGLMLVMHNALDERRREIATLRLLGFGADPVVVSVLIESIVLATIGALVGSALAWWVQDGRVFNGAWNVLRISVTLRWVGYAIGFSVFIALAGSLPIAARTLRQDILDLLGELFVSIRLAVSRLFTPLRLLISARWPSMK